MTKIFSTQNKLTLTGHQLESYSKLSMCLDNHKAVAVAMYRLAVGEGIEKPKENFAEEVAAQMKK